MTRYFTRDFSYNYCMIPALAEIYASEYADTRFGESKNEACLDFYIINGLKQSAAEREGNW